MVICDVCRWTGTPLSEVTSVIADVDETLESQIWCKFDDYICSFNMLEEQVTIPGTRGTCSSNKVTLGMLLRGQQAFKGTSCLSGILHAFGTGAVTSLPNGSADQLGDYRRSESI
jgi:hypothetical protein